MDGQQEKEIAYAYKCREEEMAGAICAKAVIPEIKTAVSRDGERRAGEK